jgi:two-component system cell cycle sensor histidine kinase/response regulator CckA
MNDPLHILLVDDNPDDRALVIRELRRDFPNLQINQVTDARHFARALESGNGDVVITDYQLRWSDGLAVLRAIKARWPECPVIMFTGTGSEEVAVEAMKAGLDDYVLKTANHYARLPGAVQRAVERKAQSRALKEAESRYLTLFNDLPIGLCKTTPAGKILDANPAAVQMLGYPDRASLLDVNAADLCVDTADSGRWQQLIGGDTVVRDFQTQLRRRDGSFISVEENIRAVRDADGRVLYFEGSVEDITQRLNLEAQLRHSQKMESVGQLAAGVAHDFNNVLTIIKGHADLLLAKDNLPADYSGSLESISSAADRAANLTRQLLTFSRRQVMQPQVLDLNEVICNVARMLERTLGENIAVRLDSASDLPPIYADAGMLEQTIMNLAVNARDAMPNGGELFIGSKVTEVTPSCAQQNPEARVGRFVCLTVADTGVGMGPQMLSRIFEPFFTTKEVGKGTGLGLATVYGITKLHRGWIEVSSEVNKGSAFKVFLPATSKLKPADVPSSGRVEREIRGGNEALLLVEDEPELRALARQILECYGYRIFEAGTGAEALKLWPQHAQEIDLLLTDMVMPEGITGWELAGKLRAERPDLKVIRASGYSIELLNKQFDSPGAFRFLQKPFKPRMLALAVRECLDA